MNVSLDDALYVNAISSVQGVYQNSRVYSGETGKTDTESYEADSYIPSAGNSSDAIPSGTYGPDAMMVGDLPSDMQVTSVSESEESTDSFMDILSNALRANEDSIIMAMNTLGLTVADLSDKSNMAALVDAMNEGAKALGVPQIEDVDAAVETLLGSLDEHEEDASAVNYQSAGGAGGSSGESEEETTTRIVTIDGITYLETTVTEDGVSTTTRTKLSSAFEGAVAV